MGQDLGGWIVQPGDLVQIAVIELAYIIGVAVMVFWRHGENLRALIAHRERQLKDQTAKSLMAIAGATVLAILLVSAYAGQLLISH